MVTFETEFSICLKQVGKHVLCLIRKRDSSLSISFFVSFQTKYHITYEQTQMTWSYTASTHPSHERNRHPPYSACLLPFFYRITETEYPSLVCLILIICPNLCLSPSFRLSTHTETIHPSQYCEKLQYINAITVFTHKWCNILLGLYLIVARVRQSVLKFKRNVSLPIKHNTQKKQRFIFIFF